MELEEDYGDIRHKHGHIHSKPKKHQQVVNTALKDWCLDIYEEDGEEKCRDLNQSFFDTLLFVTALVTSPALTSILSLATKLFNSPDLS